MDSLLDYFDTIENEEVRSLALETHAHIMYTLPEIKPAFKFGVPFYVNHKNIAYLNPKKDHVIIGFMNGIHLKHVPELVARDRKHIRHYLVHSLNDLASPVVDFLLLESFELDKKLNK